ncbi:unnamed protein product [Allacma fusca]|uniref:Integrase catalytic domain-containing protein n=1 Tax=Allacma fusca TaxID=39272 RepID=A0A8J2NQV8_9HEXA|nr:unnamed protein product [Allacma fusca]
MALRLSEMLDIRGSEVPKDLWNISVKLSSLLVVPIRAKPEEIWSDCGSNFVGANRELRDLSQFLHSKKAQEAVTNQVASEGIQWIFNPPGAPHFGGMWEAGAKSVKYHLRRVMGNVILTFEEMYTALTQIEACLNSRPLCPLSTDPTDLELIQRTVQHFWKRWSREFLSRLQQRPKWWVAQPNLKKRAIVLVKDDNLPPLKWKMGRVAEIHPDSNNLVRVATIKTAQGEIKRPVVKLALLPLDTQELLDEKS